MSSSSSSYEHNLLVCLVSIGIGILLINTILLTSHMRDMRNTRMNRMDGDMDQYENYEHTKKWDNGGIYNGIGVDNDPFQTRLACACSGYGVKRHNQDMPYDNDSNLYNSPLLRPQNLQNK